MIGLRTGLRFGSQTGLAVLLLGLMGSLMCVSAWDDSPTVDEPAHIGAGYSYLRKADYRLNPEHPPLIKDLAAMPLLILHLREPWQDESWFHASEYKFGRVLIYGEGNDADRIVRIARIPNMILSLALGWGIFDWSRRRYGSSIGSLALFFYAFSPTVLAHGHLVTTDIGAAAGFFFATIALIRFWERPSFPNVVIAGIAFGLALLWKFSTFLLVPLAIALLILRMWAVQLPPQERRLHVARFTMILLIAAVVTYSVYFFHTLHYPAELQKEITIVNLQGNGVGHTLKDLVIWASDKGVLRPISAYCDGLFATVQRVSTGNEVFFLGALRQNGGAAYFPTVYLIKEPLAFHLLTAVALLLGLSRLSPWMLTRRRLEAGFTEFLLMLIISVYWLISMRSHLNIGIRHLLPILPFTYILVSKVIWNARSRVKPYLLYPLLGACLVWQASTVLRVHPSYLAYFNELAGGPDGGYQYVVDSNLDWGQDLKRLAAFVNVRGIQRIYVEYFGGGDPQYYLGERQIGNNGCGPPAPGWLAVSAMDYQGAPWRPTCDYRRWLPADSAVTRIGHSIFVFHVP